VKTETRSFYQAAVERAVTRIVATLDEAIDLGALARGAALSPFHFHRVFRGMVGETPLEMHRRLRLERAASQLVAGTASITTVAFDTGYETHEAFTRAFRQAYGTSPSAFRQGGPLQIHLAARSGVHFGAATTRERLRFIQGDTAMNVTIEDMPELRVATVHHVGPYNRISEAFGRLHEIAIRAGLHREGAIALAIYYDDPETTAPEQLQSDAGITLPRGAPLPDGVGEKTLPAGKYARTTHLGPYSTLGDTWTRFMGEWLPSSGKRVGRGSSYEVHRNNPSNAAPEDLCTDLYLPVE
jgi:AraC family transcriptional regulator